MSGLRLDALNNRALCALNQEQWAAALHCCDLVLGVDCSAARAGKALGRRARACSGLADFTSARHDW
jgi:hypothetical protein|eukprot:COSAG02_NODE_17043_length_1033_cov_1.056745_1_plen_67_part_00